MTEHHTQEIEAPAYLDDPKVLAYLGGTDANLDRLVLEEDGKLWAYSKRFPDDLCRSSLEAMVAVAFPKYAHDAPPIVEPNLAPVDPEATEPAKALEAPPGASVPPPKPKAPRRPRDPLAGVCVPRATGSPQGLLARRILSGSAPRVTVDGVPRIAPKPIKDGEFIRVALRDTHGVMVGRAVLPRDDYDRLIDDPAIRADGTLWTLSESGEVTVRVRGNPGAIRTRSVAALLMETGSGRTPHIEFI